MNPSDFVLNGSQPTASTSQANGTGPALAGAVTANGVNGDAGMDIDPAILEDKPKSRKELEQDKKDLELGELLDMMDEWKPIVSQWPVWHSSERAHAARAVTSCLATWGRIGDTGG